MRDGQFTTTYLRDVMRLWCNRCEKSVVVETGRVDDGLLDRHRCGPPGTGWDSDQQADSFVDDENHAGGGMMREDARVGFPDPAAEFFRRVGYWRSSDRVPEKALEAASKRLHELAVPTAEGVRLDDDGRVTHVDQIVARGSCFRELACHPAVLDPLTSLLGPNIELVLNRHNHATFLYPGVVQRLHRDVLQWSRPVVTAMIYLQDTPVEAGATQLIPGSQYLPYVGTPNNGGTWMDEHHVYAGVAPQEISVAMPAGGVLLFDSLVFHRAGLNQTGTVRKALTFAYHSVDELATVDDPSRLLVAGERLRRGNPALQGAV